MWVLKNLLSPKKFFHASQVALPYLMAAFTLFATIGFIGAFLTPADYLQGDGFRIIYIHAPSAFLSLFIYAVMAACAALGIIFRLKIAFVVMRQSAPIGACFTALALITGSLWGKPMWGTWWIWDARLTSELILLFLYVAIMLLQHALTQKKSADKQLAVFVLFGFIDIPIIHYSVYWWNTLHQGATFKLFAKPAIDISMLYPLIAMLCAFICYYAIVLIMRVSYELISQDANEHWLQTS